MVSWSEFAAQAPGLAAIGEARLDEHGVCLVGSIRRHGTPRISPVEPFIVDGVLYLGMMWRSLKALDLLRDPRVLVHSLVTSRMAKGGEFKLRGTVADVPDPAIRARVEDAIEAKIGWRPDGPYHLFSVDIAQASYSVVGEEVATLAGTDLTGTRRITRADDPEGSGYLAIAWP